MSRPSRAAHAPQALDVAAFCRDGARLSGVWPLARMPRLAESVRVGDDGFAAAEVQWSAAGHMEGAAGAAPQCVVDLDIQTRVTLECQRCLQPLGLPLVVQRRLRFVTGEDEAARLDEELEDDVLALAARQDLRVFIEDELLLALPLVPRHDTCPELPAALSPMPEGGGDGPPEGDGPQHPFAALAALRRTKT